MSLKALAHKVLVGNQAGNRKATSRQLQEATSGRKLPKKLPNSVARFGQKCRECQYFDIGPTPDGKGTLYWCGPWRYANGDQHWFNLEELKVCPLNVKRQMQQNSEWQ